MGSLQCCPCPLSPSEHLRLLDPTLGDFHPQTPLLGVPPSKTHRRARLISTPQLLLYSVLHHTTIKITTEFRNVGDAAYAMSHAAAEACTQRLAAGRGHGYRHAALSLQSERGTGSGPSC